MSTALVFFFAGCAFAAWLAGRFDTDEDRRRRLLWISSTLGALAIGMIIGLTLR